MRISVTTLAAVAAMLTTACSVSSAASLAGDFTIGSNPGNGWTHGFNDVTAGGGGDTANDIPFQLANAGGNPGDRWTGDGTGDTGFPPNDLLLVNLGGGATAGDHWGGGSLTWDAGVAYHTWGSSGSAGGANDLSGDDLIFSTYTVGADGVYDISGVWTENGNSGGATVDVLVNGVSLGASSIDLDTPGDSTTIQSLGLALSAGDAVSFRTLRDTDATSGGSAMLAASVSLVPEPAAALLALIGMAGVAAGRRGRRS